MPEQKPLPLAEFVILLALMTSVMALSIDAVLPALGVIGEELNVANTNDSQLVLSAMFFGFAIGQLCAGPLSDSYGRKPVIYWGYVIFIIGCIISALASDFNSMLFGRLLQGLGAASPRIVSIALVRDGYSGRQMARIMSIVMAIFIIVPAVAPAIGQGVMAVSGWRHIFTLLLCTALVAFTWFALRQPETLSAENRRTFSMASIISGMKELLSQRIVAGYTIASGIIFGAFLGYLNSAQQIFQTTYKTGNYFAIYFGAAALTIGLASAFNSKVVVKHGMRFLTWWALCVLTAISFLFLAYVMQQAGVPNLWSFMAWLLAAFFCIGILFGNFNALAMEPVGHMAGLGAAVVGSVSTFISIPIGWVIGNQFDNTVTPLVSGFAVLGLMSIIAFRWTEKRV